MRNKTISIEEDLFVLLSQEDNASALISRLLHEHYKDSKKSETQIIDDVKNILTQKEKDAQKKLGQLNTCVNNCKEVFDIDLTIEQADEYLSGSYPNMYEYLISKGFKVEQINDEENRLGINSQAGTTAD